MLKEFKKDGNYNHSLINAINLTTKKVKSSFDLQADVAAQLVFRRCGLALGLGYNVYYRSKEKLKFKENFFDNKNKRYGIKGGTGVAARLWNALPGSPGFGELTGELYTLNSTESKVRLINTPGIENAGFIDNQVYLQPPVTPIEEGPPLTRYEVATRWDQLQPIPYSYTNPPVTDSDSLILVDTEYQPQPSTLTDNDIIKCSGTIPSQLSHKFFGHINYEWEGCCSCPYIGIGGEVEFSSKCKTGTLSQWGIWVHLGLNF